MNDEKSVKTIRDLDAKLCWLAGIENTSKIETPISTLYSLVRDSDHTRHHHWLLDLTNIITDQHKLMSFTLMTSNRENLSSETIFDDYYNFLADNKESAPVFFRGVANHIETWFEKELAIYYGFGPEHIKTNTSLRALNVWFTFRWDAWRNGSVEEFVHAYQMLLFEENLNFPRSLISRSPDEISNKNRKSKSPKSTIITRVAKAYGGEFVFRKNRIKLTSKPANGTPSRYNPEALRQLVNASIRINKGLADELESGRYNTPSQISRHLYDYVAELESTDIQWFMLRTHIEEFRFEMDRYEYINWGGTLPRQCDRLLEYHDKLEEYLNPENRDDVAPLSQTEIPQIDLSKLHDMPLNSAMEEALEFLRSPEKEQILAPSASRVLEEHVQAVSNIIGDKKFDPLDPSGVLSFLKRKLISLAGAIFSLGMKLSIGVTSNLISASPLADRLRAIINKLSDFLLALF